MKSSRPVVKRRRKTTKNEVNSNKGRNTEPDVVTISSSSSDSQSNGNPGSESDDREAKTSDITNNTPNDLDDNDDDNDDGKENEEREDVKSGNLKKEDQKVSAYKFPMQRVQRIVRSEGSDDLRVTQEAILLINKASEKFLELFCEDAYAASVEHHKNYVEHHKNYVAYHHLSSIVSKERRFDFLSDFIPEKVKAEDALKEKKLAMD